jgi:hypothetical protein
MDAHVRSLLHETRYKQLEKAQKSHIAERKSNFIEQSQHLRERVNQLGLRKWRVRVGNFLSQYIETPLPEHAATYPNQEEICRLDKVKTELALCEQMESLSIVELAFIKVKQSRDVIISDESNACTTDDDFRKVAFVTCGTSDILRGVAHFLGKPPAIDDLEYFNKPRM